MPAALISSVLLLIVLARQRRDAVFFLALTSFVLMIAALAITLTVNVPIDNDISRWTPSSLPADWTATRDRWEAYHTDVRLGGRVGMRGRERTVLGPTSRGVANMSVGGLA